MAGDKQQQHTLHLVVFPWLAFGHLIPFLELSKRLAARGYAVTFVSTPRNIARLPALAEGLSGRVRMVALPLPAVDGLPERAESTADVPPEKVELLKAGFDGLAAPLADFLAAACAGDPEEEEEGVFGTRPDWIVLDFAHYWLCPIAEKHQLNASGVADSERYSRTVDHCRLLVVRSCHEVEPRVFPILAELFRKPVVPAGLLLPAAGDRHHGGDHSDTTTRGLIARMMAERGVGVEVARRDDDEGWFGRDDVAVAVRRVMVEEDGKASVPWGP
nr:unnamed protein product [Digitaria exilis]